jgi:hypothetical protein
MSDKGAKRNGGPPEEKNFAGEGCVVSPKKLVLAACGLGLTITLLFSQPLVSLRPEMANSSAISRGPAEEVRLAAVLNKAIGYCRKLEKASLDFVCLEEISEKIDYSRDREDEIAITPSLGEKGIITQIKIPKRKQENTYLYDFQFTRKGELKKENRTLLEKNGKMAREKEAPLETSVFQVRNVLFGPLGLLNENMQGYHDYQFIGEEEVQNEKLAVIEVTPKKTLTGSHAYGRVWIKEGDGSVLKIEWKPESIPNFESLEARAKKYRSELSVTLVTEYGFEKNGIRFPSRDDSEEAYLKPGGKKFVRSRTSVVYRDYKFFTVETDIKY